MKLFNFLLVALVMFGTYSCQQDKGKLKLTLIVIAEKNVRVANAVVRCYAPVEGSFIDWYDFTSEEGTVEYKFNQPVVVEIIANKGSFKACTSVQVNQDEQTETLELKPFGADNNGCLDSTP